MTFDVLFDVVIFVVVINSFRRCDNSLFDVLIALINLFDVLIVYGVFGVLFGFRRCDFRSSDLFPLGRDMLIGVWTFVHTRNNLLVMFYKICLV